MASDMQSTSSTPTAPWRDFRPGLSTAPSGYTSSDEKGWPALPTAPTKDFTKAYQRPHWDKQERAHRFNKVLFRSLYFTVRSTTRNSPYDRYLEAEKGRDNSFMEYLATNDGQTTLAKVFSQYRGLKTTIKITSDVGWFLREACTPGSYLHRLLDDMLPGEAHRPYLSLWQYVLLALLTSPTRRLGLWQIPRAIASICKRWSDAEQDDELRHWIHQIFGISEHDSDDSCELIASPHDNLVVRHNPVANGLGMIACEAISIRAGGEENHFFTKRWSDVLHQHFHAPPYNSNKRYLDPKTKGPADINRLPPEIMLQIFGYVANFDGLIVLDFDAHQRRFECNWFLQGLQGPLSPSKTWEHAHMTPMTFLKSFLDLRFVNRTWSVQVMTALFESQSIMFQQDGAPIYEDTFTDEQMTCFVPWRGENNITDLDVIVQY
ncbi:hypothetical protein FB567DRAFT_597479 [Paraphoma chrysanthemicola]|uniref:Uncharacterized protein n=1 Tax=Paraphoma chrysanthemicola TaxID=798071 RepID=A0A8K0QX44_9PLEO|nr:hypothetical protein FB567DRAFT_597479 [Paraphoma chrysanthemicola]